jgi:hypothetical protein
MHCVLSLQIVITDQLKRCWLFLSSSTICFNTIASRFTWGSCYQDSVPLSSQAADAVSMLHGAEEKLLQQEICLSTFFLMPLIFKQLKELDMKSDGYEYNYFHRRARSTS